MRPVTFLQRQEGGDYWCPPGGGLENGESLEAGIEREMAEETGIKPIIGQLLYIQQFAFDSKEYLEFFFNIINSKDYLQVDLTKTSHGEKELEEIKFIDPKAVHILPTFLSTKPLEEFAKSNDPARLLLYL